MSSSSINNVILSGVQRSREDLIIVRHSDIHIVIPTINNVILSGVQRSREDLIHIVIPTEVEESNPYRHSDQRGGIYNKCHSDCSGDIYNVILIPTAVESRGSNPYCHSDQRGGIYNKRHVDRI